MSAASGSAETAVDVAFALEGRSLPRDHAQALADALAAHLPWLAGHPTAGVHSVKVVPGSDPSAWLSLRARLLLRVPKSREAALAALAGRTLDRGRHRAAPGRRRSPTRCFRTAPCTRPSWPPQSDDEAAFMRGVDAELAAIGIDCRKVCGKRQERVIARRRRIGFSLMLHELNAADSLTVQCVGLGPHRGLGCGLFVPHKSAAAVGS